MTKPTFQKTVMGTHLKIREDKIDHQSHVWNTSEIFPPSKPQENASVILKFDKDVRNVKGLSKNIALGLNYIDLNNGEDFHVKTSVTAVLTDSVKTTIESWGKSKLTSIGVTMLDITTDNVEHIQCGTFTVSKQRDFPKPPHQKVTTTITFDKPYTYPPRVIVWFNGFDLSNRENPRIHTYVSDITNERFRLDVNSWDSRFNDVSVTWISHESCVPGIQSGIFSTEEQWCHRNARQHTKGVVEYLPHKFSKKPKVFVGFCKIDTDHQKYIRVKAGTCQESEKSFEWYLEAWKDSTLYRGNVAWIAIQEYDESHMNHERECCQANSTLQSRMWKIEERLKQMGLSYVMDELGGGDADADGTEAESGTRTPGTSVTDS